MQNTMNLPSGETRGWVMLLPVTLADNTVSTAPQESLFTSYGMRIRL